MNYIPIVDFSSSETNSKEEISEKVKSALANVGFLYIVNHGVDKSKVNNMNKEIFFDYIYATSR